MEDHSVPKAAVGGFVSGLVAGGALALLSAPASGRLTRARLNHGLRERLASAREFEERMSFRLRERAGSARGLKERLWRRLRPARPDTVATSEPTAS